MTSFNSHAASLPYSLSILVVDDHKLVVDGLEATLQRLGPEVDLHHAANVQQAMGIIRSKPNIDLILLDLSLPDGRGIKLLKFLSENNFFIPAAILSASEDPVDIQLAISAGAQGFIGKSTDGEELLSALQGILNGETYLPKSYRTRIELGRPVITGPTNITPRQKDVLKLLAKGLSNKKICLELGLKEDTVKTHLKALFAQFNVHNRTECVSVAIRLNLLD